MRFLSHACRIIIKKPTCAERVTDPSGNIPISGRQIIRNISTVTWSFYEYRDMAAVSSRYDMSQVLMMVILTSEAAENFTHNNR